MKVLINRYVFCSRLFDTITQARIIISSFSFNKKKLSFIFALRLYRLIGNYIIRSRRFKNFQLLFCFISTRHFFFQTYHTVRSFEIEQSIIRRSVFDYNNNYKRAILFFYRFENNRICLKIANAASLVMLRARECVRVLEYIPVYIYIHRHIYIYRSIINVCVCIRVCICIYVYVYVCMYISTRNMCGHM